MKRYFKIYTTLLGMNFQTLTTYRANFINSIISSILWGSMTFITIFILTTRTNNVYGWTREELLLLTAIYNIIIGAFHMVFSKNFERFSEIIHFGRLDGLLMKPVDPQFLMSFWFFNYTSLFRIIAGVVFAVLLLNSQPPSLLSLALFAVLGLVGIALMYSIWYMISTLIIKFTNLSNIIDLLYQVNGFARFPQEMFRQLNVFAFSFLLPITIVVTVPTKLLISKATFADFILFLGTSVIFFICARMFWKFSLRYYTSASG